MIHGPRHFKDTFHKVYARKISHPDQGPAVWTTVKLSVPTTPMFPVTQVIVPIDPGAPLLIAYVPGWRDERGLIWISKSEHEALEKRGE